MTFNYGVVTLLTETIILMSLNGFLKILLVLFGHMTLVFYMTLFSISHYVKQELVLLNENPVLITRVDTTSTSDTSNYVHT